MTPRTLASLLTAVQKGKSPAEALHEAVRTKKATTPSRLPSVGAIITVTTTDNHYTIHSSVPIGALIWGMAYASRASKAEGREAWGWDPEVQERRVPMEDGSKLFEIIRSRAKGAIVTMDGVILDEKMLSEFAGS